MDAIRHALQGQLEETLERLKGLGGAVVFEDYPGALEDDGQGDAGGDGASLSEERELAFEVRGRLVERANRLSGALDRHRVGDYGAWLICGESRRPRPPPSPPCAAARLPPPFCRAAPPPRLAGAHGRSLNRHEPGTTGTQASGQVPTLG